MQKVLFCDNDATIRIIAKNAIEGHWLGDVKVHLAANGTEALKIATRELPDLIILDVIMPGLDGVQTLKKLREQGAKAPVVFVTAKEDVSELNTFQHLNVSGILKKPFLPRNLLEECSKVLDKK
ncbi:MAG: response regulator [Candidatus Obscuribacterales bacterium]|jgi:CheY-like chemotaxis protein|nr:response regulator [Candidatus Obscuribacterales bacterium]